MSSSHVSRVIARRNDEAISSQRRHSNQIASLPFATTPQRATPPPPPRVIARRHDEAISASGGTQTRLLHYRSQRHPKGNATASESCHCDKATTKQPRSPRSARDDTQASACVIARRNDEAISASSGPNTRLRHSVRNDTQRATPPPPTRVIARRQRRSNPDRRAPLAMTPRPIHVSWRKGTTKQIQASGGT